MDEKDVALQKVKEAYREKAASINASGDEGLSAAIAVNAAELSERADKAEEAAASVKEQADKLAKESLERADEWAYETIRKTYAKVGVRK